MHVRKLSSHLTTVTPVIALVVEQMKSGGPDDPLECISIINNLVLLFIDQHMHRPPGSQVRTQTLP